MGELALEHGAKYLDGMGNEVVVSLTHPATDYPFTGDNFNRYMADGQYLEDCPETLADLCLVSKIDD